MLASSIENEIDEQANVLQSVTVKSDEQLEEDDLLASSDEGGEEKSDNEDEIDLFASEESESENEGRFKSSTSKTERPTNSSTLSFSKLGNASDTMQLVDLNDVVKTDKSFAAERGAGRRGDRNNDDRYRGRNNNYSSRSGRDDRYRGRRNDRGSAAAAAASAAYKPSSSSSTSGKSEDRKKDERSMFKSTFQSVESTTKGKSLPSPSPN